MKRGKFKLQDQAATKSGVQLGKFRDKTVKTKGQAKDKIDVKKQRLNLGSKQKIEVKPAVFTAGFVNLAFKTFLKAFQTSFTNLAFKTSLANF